jgi:LIVCS family branched-chain amino acid:cation transporter
MKRFFTNHTLATGLAMFSMFFGAGNVVFPLLLGQYAGDKNLFAMLGMFITAIIVPFTGLLTMMLFEGDYKAFFARVGRLPGYFVAVLILMLIGPFGGIPRCIALSYATVTLSLPEMPLWLFSLIACALTFVFSVRKSKVLDLLGYVLTPLLLVSLAVIVIKGLISHPESSQCDASNVQVFMHGLKEGYNTLDLLAAFFFSTVIVNSLRSRFGADISMQNKKMSRIITRASLIGAILLGAIYTGLSFVAAYYGPQTDQVPPDQLLGAIAFKLLGSEAGLIANIAVALACLTTAITLAAVFADALSKEIFKGRVGYVPSLVMTLTVAYLVSYLRFTGIVKLIAPLVVVSYPALIVLCLLSLAHKIKNVQSVKAPVFVMLVISAVAYLL